MRFSTDTKMTTESDRKNPGARKSLRRVTSNSVITIIQLFQCSCLCYWAVKSQL